ncbi:hypothetical protein DK871_15420 [Pseudomonas sp. L13]|nr:hypothetical protein [Pseudomonas sp. L13]
MLAKNVNDNACLLNERGACEFFASKLAPTRELRCLGKFRSTLQPVAGNESAPATGHSPAG